MTFDCRTSSKYEVSNVTQKTEGQSLYILRHFLFTNAASLLNEAPDNISWALAVKGNLNFIS
jgi:hypothetical protein